MSSQTALTDRWKGIPFGAQQRLLSFFGAPKLKHFRGLSVAVKKAIDSMVVRVSIPRPTFSDFRGLGKFRNLRALCVEDGSLLGNIDFVVLAQLGTLRRVTFKNIGRHVVSWGLQGLSQMKKLTHLKLVSCLGLKDSWLPLFPTSLRSLTLDCTNWVEDDTETNHDIYIDVQKLARLKNLEELKLIGYWPEMDQFYNCDDLTTLPKLKSLCFKQNHNGEPKYWISAMKSLTYLDLSNCALEDKALKKVAKLTSLTHLDLGDNTKLTNKGIGHLTKLVNLNWLSLFSLYSHELTTEGVRRLTSLQKLTFLDVEECEWVDRKGLFQIFPSRVKIRT